MNESQINVGAVVTVKVGRNEVEVTVIAITADGWKVKSNSSGREFEVKKLERIISETPSTLEDAEPETVSKFGQLEKKLSLLDAAAQVLEGSTEPLNSKEIIAKAIADGLWTPSGAKTPEQSLYSAMFREIKTKEKPRFKKSEIRKGGFEFRR